jgi:hypothetical protein
MLSEGTAVGAYPVELSGDGEIIETVEASRWYRRTSNSHFPPIPAFWRGKRIRALA